MLRIALLWISALFLWAGCFEPHEGCLDIEAVNFDAAADKACCCCCNYPKLRLRYLPLFDTATWLPNAAYEYAPGRWFRIRQAVFYLSGFQGVQNGQAYSITDTINLSVRMPAGDTVRQTFTNDFFVLRRTVVDYTVGEFRAAGKFSGMRFRVGVPDAAQRVIPALAPEGHPLRPQPEDLWLGPDRGFAALRLVITRDTLPDTPTDTLTFGAPDFPSQMLESPGPFRRESGYDFRLQLAVNYRELFRSVDLTTGDISAWKTQIWNNLGSALLVIPE